MHRNYGSGLSPRCIVQGARPVEQAFTLIELLVGMSLALMVMTAVLTTYVTLGRNFTRSLGITSANQPALTTQARRTLAYFAQDGRMASGISGTPSASSLALLVPTGTGTKTVSYYINNTSSATPVTLSGFSKTVPAQTLVRVDGATGLMQQLQSSLYLSGTNSFSYYDSTGNTYIASDLSAGNYLVGIKQIALSLSAQAGSATNGTLTPVYYAASPRVLLRNRSTFQ